MNQTAIFWPMIAHAVLVFIVYGLMFMRRKAAVVAGSVKISQFRENQNEPAESLFVRNNLANQFELPVLFHAVCLALYVTAGAGTPSSWPGSSRSRATSTPSSTSPRTASATASRPSR